MDYCTFYTDGSGNYDGIHLFQMILHTKRQIIW